MKARPTASSIRAATASFVERQNLVKKKQEAMVQLLDTYVDETEFVSTGLASIDAMLGGGIPTGKILQIYGPNQAGKTSLCLHIAAKYDFCVWIDAESTLSKERAVLLGVNPKRFLLVSPETGEQAIDAIKQYIKANVPLIVVDSVAAMVPAKQLIVDEKETPEKQAGISLTAGLMSRHIFSIANACRLSGVTVLFVNQVRDKVGGFMSFGPQIYTPGGRALGHALSMNIKMDRSGKLKVSDDTLGITIKLAMEKNKVTHPFLDAEVGLIFDAGFMELAAAKEELKPARARSLARRRARLGIAGGVEHEEEIQDEGEDDPDVE